MVASQHTSLADYLDLSRPGFGRNVCGLVFLHGRTVSYGGAVVNNKTQKLKSI